MNKRISPQGRNDTIWQMKKRGSVGVRSTAPKCGYTDRQLESLKKAGWHLYDGEKKIW